MTTTKDAIENNTFLLFDCETNYEEATISLKESVDHLIEVMRLYKDVGAKDTECRDAIAYYISNNI